MNKNNENNPKSKHDDILKTLSNGGVWSVNQIRKKLLSQNPQIKISLQGIEKHLDKMEEMYEVAYFDSTKRNIEFIKEVYPQTKMNSKIKKYYIGIPLSSKLFKRIKNVTKRFDNQEKYDKIINEIMRTYRGLEIIAPHQKNELTNEDAVKRSLRENRKGKKRVTDNLTQKKIQNAKIDVESFNKKIVKLKIPIETLTINDKKYFMVNDELIPLEKLIYFLNILEMTDYMKWIAYNIEKNRVDHTHPLLTQMKNLFIEIASDSQFKFQKNI